MTDVHALVALPPGTEDIVEGDRALQGYRDLTDAVREMIAAILRIEGIEATLDVLGAPRYTVTPKYTPLANFCDAFNGSAKFGKISGTLSPGL